MGKKRRSKKGKARFEADSAKNQSSVNQELQQPATEALSVVVEEEEETRPSTGRPSNNQEFNKALRRAALEEAAQHLLSTGIKLLDHESLFTKVCAQKHACRQKIVELKKSFEARQQMLKDSEKRAGTDEKRAFFARCMMFNNSDYLMNSHTELQSSQCIEWDYFTEHVSDALRASHEAMMLTMTLVETHVDRQDSFTLAMEGRLKAMEAELAKLKTDQVSLSLEQGLARMARQLQAKSVSESRGRSELVRARAGPATQARSASETRARSASLDRQYKAELRQDCAGMIKEAQLQAAMNQGQTWAFEDTL